MTWFKNNLWAIILGVFCAIQISLVVLKTMGVIQWHSALVMLPTLILCGLALFAICCVIIFLDIDEEDYMETDNG